VNFSLQKLFKEQFTHSRFKIYDAGKKLHALSLGKADKLVLDDQVVLSKQNFEGVFDDWIVDRVQHEDYLLQLRDLR